MKTNSLLAKVALLASFALLSPAAAQDHQGIRQTADIIGEVVGQVQNHVQTQQWIPQTTTQVIPQVTPPVRPQVYPLPTPANRYYFGMNVQLTPSTNGYNILRIASVTPGSPAASAGLEVGDEIHSVNSGRFQSVSNSFQAVRRMNNLVVQESMNPYPGTGIAPAAASAAYVTPYPVVATRSVARMMVRNIRNGQMLQVAVYPTTQAQFMPLPAPATPAAASPSFR